MKNLAKYGLLIILAAMLIVAPAPLAQAQGVLPGGGKVVAALSIQPVDKLLSDAAYLAKVADATEEAQQFLAMAGMVTNGMDKKRPAGAIVVAEGENIKFLGFVPLENKDMLLGGLKIYLGETKDAGDGVIETDGLVNLFLKEQGAWMYVAQDAKSLANLPADPSALLGGLDQQYAIAGRIFVQDIPESYRKMAIDQMRAGMAMGLEGMDEDSAESEAAQKLAGNLLKSLIQSVNEVDQVTFGWAVDQTNKTTYLDWNMTAVPGTPTAAKAARLADSTSQVSGLLMPDAAVAVNLTLKLSPENTKWAAESVGTLKTRTLEEIDADEDLADAERAMIKEVLAELFDVLENTAKDGKIDAATAVLLGKEKLAVVVGAQLADGATLEAALKKLVKLAGEDAEGLNIKFNVGTHAGVNLHTLVMPMDPDSPGAVVGEKLDVIVGTGAKTVWVAGKDATAILKKVIDDSAAGQAKKVPPFQLIVKLTPILSFVESIAKNPIADQIATELATAPGSDHVSLALKPIPNGTSLRLLIEEGVIKAIAIGAKSTVAADDAEEKPAVGPEGVPEGF